MNDYVIINSDFDMSAELKDMIIQSVLGFSLWQMNCEPLRYYLQLHLNILYDQFDLCFKCDAENNTLEIINSNKIAINVSKIYE